MRPLRRCLTGLFAIMTASFTSASEQAGIEPPPASPFHLSARPWRPLSTPRSQYLDAIEGICRFTVKHQDASGAVIDAFLHREHQYSTPYFAFAVGLLVREGRAADLLEPGSRAMDHATARFARGNAGIPDEHG